MLFSISVAISKAQYIKNPDELYNKVKYEQKNYTKYLYYPEVLAMHIEKARAFYIKGNYQAAINKYNMILDTDTTNPFIYHELGLCYFNQGFISKEKALEFFKISIRKSIPGDTIQESFFYLGKTYHMIGEHEIGIKYLEHFKGKIKDSYSGYILADDMNRQIETSTNAIFYKNDAPTPHAISNLGKVINTNTGQYNPIVNGEMSTLIYSEKNNAYPQSARDNTDELLMITKFQPDGKWSKPSKLKESSKLVVENLDKKAQMLGFSLDNTEIYVYQLNDIYLGKITKGKYVTLKPWNCTFLDKKAYEPHFYFTKDGNSVYFTSDREGGYGGLDIYRSVKNEDSTWTVAENLGPIINSKYDEITPFMTTENDRLYFSSLGHSSMGGYDVFYSDNIKEDWSLPKNMRQPINSSMDDLGFVIGPNNKTGLISSSREGGKGDMDIYEFAIECAFINTVRLRGVVMTKDDELVETQITFTNKISGKKVVAYAAASKKGSFIVELKANTNYVMSIERGGYLKQTQEIHTPKQCEPYEIFQVIHMNKKKTGENKIEQTVSFRNAFFDIQKHLLVEQRDVFEKGLIDACTDFINLMEPEDTELNYFINEKKMELNTDTVIADIVKDTIPDYEVENALSNTRVLVDRKVEQISDTEYVVTLNIKHKEIEGSVKLSELIPAHFTAEAVQSAGADMGFSNQELSFT
ncbi:MAG: PD40 domain-containing protein [Flavobacteriales bacterium]|nr:PD40 domain-containing protein [Flavobacteriales bacterium]